MLQTSFAEGNFFDFPSQTSEVPQLEAHSHLYFLFMTFVIDDMSI